MNLNHLPSPRKFYGDESTEFPLKLIAAGIILVVSAVAASFPTLAKRAPRIQPSEIVFFITKHFGTGEEYLRGSGQIHWLNWLTELCLGVILATAFVHLLQEAFESLNHPAVSGSWKELTGLIV